MIIDMEFDAFMMERINLKHVKAQGRHFLSNYETRTDKSE